MSNSTTPVDTSTTAPLSTSSTLIDTSTTPPPTTAVQTTSSSTTAPATTPSSVSTAAVTTPISTSTPPSSTSATVILQTSVTTAPSSAGHPASTFVVTVTSTSFEVEPSSTGSSSSTSTKSVGLAGASSGSKSSSNGGLSSGGKTAIAVVIPIVVVAALIGAGIWWWRRRRANKDAEDLRRKEVEEYGYNPNDDPTLPAVGDGPFEMVQDGNSGYRGWGTTAAGSSNRKGSTTVSGGAGQGVGSQAYSESTSPTLNNAGVADNRSGDPLMTTSPTGHPGDEGEILGAMGPATSNNRGEVQRGPSNASSSYSAANRSDGSGEAPAPGGAIGQASYYNEYAGGNSGPYNEGGYGNAGAGGGQPVIRDVQAKRNTRIEHPSHFPQAGGISQNF